MMTSVHTLQSETSLCSHFFKGSNTSDCTQFFRKGQYYSCKRSLIKHLNDMKRAKIRKEEKENVENISFSSIEKESSLNVAHMEWVIRHNIIICNIMEFKTSVSYHEQMIEMTKTEDAFLSLFQELHGVEPTCDQLTLELGISYNLISWLLRSHITDLSNSFPKFWPYVQRTLERVYIFSTRDKSLKCRSLDDIISFVPGIIHHSKSLKKETTEIIFLLYCCLFWVMTVFQKRESGRFLIKMLERLVRKKEPDLKDETLKFFWIQPLSLSQSVMPSRMEIIGLIRICYHMAKGANRKDLPFKVDEIMCTLWASFISYLKAYILFQREMYHEALDAVLKVGKNGTAEKWIKARICNLIGCCFEKQGKYQMAKEWFSKAVAADSTYFVPLLNIVMVFKKKGDQESELKALKLLVQATFVNNRSRLDSVTLKNKGCEFHINQPDPEVFHWQAVYLLGLRYSHFQMYNESSLWFLKLIDILKETSALKIPVDNGYLLPSSLHTILHQAAYALLRANRLIECIGICNLAIENYSQKSEKEYSDSMESLHSKPSLDISFSRYMDVLPSLESGKDLLDDVEETEVKISDTCGITELINSSLIRLETKSLQELRSLSIDVMSYFIKVAALFHLGNDEKSLEDLRRLRATFLTECAHHICQEDEEITSESEEVSHPAKRCCTRDVSQGKVRKRSKQKELGTEVSVILFIKSQIYNNMAIIHIKHGQLNDAVHLLRLSQICYPENMDSIYNYTLLLLKLGKRHEASVTWKAARLKESWKFNSCSLTLEQAQEMDEIFSDEINETNSEKHL